MITESYMDGDDIYMIKIGQNKTENWSLLDTSNPDNIWFHVSGSPSAYVVLTTVCDMKQVPARVLYRCAILCKMRSKSVKECNCNVNYTYVKHVTKGEKEGEAIIKQAKVIRV